MLGDNCSTCNHTADSCTCSKTVTPSPCLPGPDNKECDSWISAACVFYMGDPIPGTPIEKGMRLTEVITYLLGRITALETA